MVHLLALHDYRSTRDGRNFDWRAGEAVDVAGEDLAWLVKDSPGLFDLVAPLTPDQVADLKADRDRAELEQLADAAQRASAVRAHIREHSGSWCLLGRIDPRPHLDELTAVADGGGWRVGCDRCHRALAAAGLNHPEESP
jgi:hypothetical protein